MDVTYYFDEYPQDTVLSNQYDYVTFMGFDGTEVFITGDGAQYNSGFTYDDGTVMQGRGNTLCCAPYLAGSGVFKGNFGFVLDYPLRVSFWIGYTDQPGSTTVTLYSDTAMDKIVDIFMPTIGYSRYESAMKVRAMKLVQVNEAAGTELDNLTLYDIDPLARIKRQRQSPKGSPPRVGWR